VPAEKVDQLREAIQSYRDVQSLLGRWERESAAIIFGRSGRKSRPGKKID
jgi:hypothetical protein